MDSEEMRIKYDDFKSDPFFQLGLGLYWAHGAQKGTAFHFVSSDAHMILVMLTWIERYLGLKRDQIHARLYIQETFAKEPCEKYWANSLKIPVENFKRTVTPASRSDLGRLNYLGSLRLELNKVRYHETYTLWRKWLLEDYRKQGYC